MKEKIRKLVLPVATMGATALYAFPSFAADFDAVTLVTTSATSIQGDMLDTINTVTPIAMVVVGAVMAIRFGVSFFSKITGAKK